MCVGGGGGVVNSLYYVSFNTIYNINTYFISG